MAHWSYIEYLSKIWIYIASGHPAVMGTWWNEKRYYMNGISCEKRCIEWVSISGVTCVKSAELSVDIYLDYKYSPLPLLLLKTAMLVSYKETTKSDEFCWKYQWYLDYKYINEPLA